MKIVFLLVFSIPFLIFSQEETPVISDNIGNCDTIYIQKDTSIVRYPDQEAQFPGGSAKMKKYIIEHLQYPKIEFETPPYGKVFVEFIVNIDGSIEQVEIQKGGIKELDEMYIQLVKNMPNWIPAEVDGKKVRSRILLPFSIHFQ